jgi:hypothetical protein
MADSFTSMGLEMGMTEGQFWVGLTSGRVRTLIEKLIKTIEPSARLSSFGSSCNSFGLRNSGERVFLL